MRFAASWPWWVMLGLAAVFAAAGWGYVRPLGRLSTGRRRLLTGIRLAVFLLILLLLARPVRVEPALADRAVLPILLDRSRSMASPTRAAFAASTRRWPPSGTT